MIIRRIELCKSLNSRQELSARMKSHHTVVIFKYSSVEKNTKSCRRQTRINTVRQIDSGYTLRHISISMQKKKQKTLWSARFPLKPADLSPQTAGAVREPLVHSVEWEIRESKGRWWFVQNKIVCSQVVIQGNSSSWHLRWNAVLKHNMAQCPSEQRAGRCSLTPPRNTLTSVLFFCFLQTKMITLKWANV